MGDEFDAMYDRALEYESYYDDFLEALERGREEERKKIVQSMTVPVRDPLNPLPPVDWKARALAAEKIIHQWLSASRDSDCVDWEADAKAATRHHFTVHRDPPFSEGDKDDD